MSKLSKNRKSVIGKYNNQQDYPLSEAAQLVKDLTTTKFDASVDLAIKLGVDPRNANENIRGTVLELINYYENHTLKGEIVIIVEGAKN